MQAAGCEVRVAEPGTELEDVFPSKTSVCALLGATFRGGVIDRPTLARFPELRIVSKYTIGVDDVDVDAATDLGVLVSHCPTEANWGGVAEGTLAFMLALLKKVRLRSDRVKGGGWRSPELEGVYLGARDDGYAGITVGIIGLGSGWAAGCRSLLAPWRRRAESRPTRMWTPAVFARPRRHRALISKHCSAESDVVTLHCNSDGGNAVDDRR